MQIESRSSFGWPATKAAKAQTTQGIALHYNGSDQGLAKKPHEACRAYWQATRKFHMSSRGWVDLGYSYAVCVHGVILEGRGFGRTQAAQPGGNSTWVSVTFMSGPKETPTAEQLQAFAELRAWLRGNGVAAAIRPHSAWVSTSCPGSILRGLINNGTLAKAPTTTPPPAPTTTEATVKALPTLRHGSGGEDVQTLQGLLIARSHPEVKVDGDFGPATEAALKAVQAWGGVAPDGVCGVASWPVLLRVH